MVTKIEDHGDGEGLFQVDCDMASCKESHEIEGNWTTVINWLKEQNWKFNKVAGEWMHFCTNCKAKADFA